MRNQSISVGVGLLVWGLVSLGVGIATAAADLVTFQFAGTISGTGNFANEGFDILQPISGSYMFNSATPPSAGAPGQYNGAITGVTASLNSRIVVAGPPLTSNILVLNDLGTPPSQIDQYRVTLQFQGAPAIGGYTLTSLSIILIDPSHTALDNSSLATAPPSLSSFATKDIRFVFRNGTAQSTVNGHITSLTAVSIPASVLLFGTGLAALVGLGAGSWQRRVA